MIKMQLKIPVNLTVAIFGKPALLFEIPVRMSVACDTLHPAAAVILALAGYTSLTQGSHCSYERTFDDCCY